MRPLYKDTLPSHDHGFKKAAGFASRLSEQPEMWPQELTSDLFKQLPYLSDYDVNVNLDRVDDGRGFAFGYADVHNRTERPEQEHDEAGLPHLRIPIVVQERQVKPFSVFLDGEQVLPLNEERVREQLFNPATFDLSTSPPVDPSLVEPLMPPHRSGIGMGGDYKLASADEKLLAMLGGKTKKADIGEAAQSTPPAVDSRSSWLREFDHTPFYDRALSLERKQLQLDLLANRQEQEREVERKETQEPDLSKARETLRLQRRQLELERQLHCLSPKEKVSFIKKAFKHISKEQWEAIYGSLDVQKMVQEYGSRSHPAVQNRVYEMATKLYGYHPKPEPPAPGKLEEYKKKLMEKQQKEQQKQFDKGQKMMQEGTKMLSSGQQKKASVERGSLLLAIAPTVRTADREAFFKKIASDPTLRAGLRRSGIGPVLQEFANTKLASANDRLRAVADRIEPTCITFQKLPGGDFFVKSANTQAFAQGPEAQGEVVPGEQMGEAIGPDQAQAMQPGQSVSAVSDPIPEDVLTPQEPNADAIQEFGEYLVQDKMGNQMLGWVFPETLSWDGQFSPTPVALFTNGAAFALQDEIVGELAGKSQTLPVSPPRGEGVFYTVDRDGAVVTAPVTIKGGMTGPDGGEMYTCVDFMGNQFTVHLSPELAQPQAVSEGEYALPATWKFMALNQQTQLQGSTEEMNKTSAARRDLHSVELFWNGAFNLEGGCGLQKLARSYRYDLDALSAEFMLGVLGVPGPVIKEKLAHARKKGVVKLANLKTITTLGERYAKHEKTASALASQVPNLRRDLLKEAAALENESTVDKVLALNFINPENLATFVDYVPQLEETSEHLAEMLLSSYLGMEQIPEGAVENTMRHMEEVVQSLKAVQHAEA